MGVGGRHLYASTTMIYGAWKWEFSMQTDKNCLYDIKQGTM
jgi:hypothetical protein